MTTTPARPTTRADHVSTYHGLAADDGLPLNLLQVRGRREPTRGPVMLVHGSGVRAEIFRPPVERSFVDVLLDDGWDVWLLNWRASIDFDPVPWTLDDAAAYDHPAAVRYVLEATGAPSMKAVVHCQGSTSLSMSAVAGLLPGLDTIVSNAVSLHPVIPPFSRFKISRLTAPMQRMTPYLSPAWGDEPTGVVGRVLRTAVQATHRECDNSVCRMVSFTYGSGRPALWRHEHLDDATHDWVRGEFAEVPMTFFRQMNACQAAGHLVPVSVRPGLPASYGDDQAPRTRARFALFAGTMNRCFLPESQVRTHRYLDTHRPGYDSLHLLPGYSHLDVFWGRNAVHDVFPLMLQELDRPAPAPAHG